MASMDFYPRAAMERAMKVQDVMLQAMAKKITWWQAAEILGISDRHMRRWRERYEQEGYNGLLDRRRGKPSTRRVPLATVEKVFALYREKYFDLNVQHFHEKLEAEHGISLSYTWVKQALQGAGLVARGRKRGCIANGARGGLCRACCCTSMAVVTSGFKTNATLLMLSHGKWCLVGRIGPAARSALAISL